MRWNISKVELNTFLSASRSAQDIPESWQKLVLKLQGSTDATIR
jgi:hypothetical protein